MARFKSPETREQFARKMAKIREARIETIGEIVRLVLPEAGDPFILKRLLAKRAEALVRSGAVTIDTDYFQKHGRVACYIRNHWPSIKDHLAVDRRLRVEVSTGVGRGKTKRDAGVRRADNTGTLKTTNFERTVLAGSLEHHNTKIEAAPASLNLVPLTKALREVVALLEANQGVK